MRALLLFQHLLLALEVDSVGFDYFVLGELLGVLGGFGLFLITQGPLRMLFRKNSCVIKVIPIGIIENLDQSLVDLEFLFGFGLVLILGKSNLVRQIARVLAC